MTEQYVGMEDYLDLLTAIKSELVRKSYELPSFPR